MGADQQSEPTPTRPPAEVTSAGAPAARPLPSQVGRYRILARVGAGGMGTVYKAHDPQLQRVVAVKVPRFAADPDGQPELVRRFLREARAAAAIRHPHVCPIYDVGEQDGRPFVVMAFVEGQSLADRLQDSGRYEDPAEAVRLVREVAQALAAVHANGVIHRDLKPANILLDRDGRSVLTDFGLARSEQDAEHLTGEGLVVGTPAFMAPEQAAGQSAEVGPRTDLYSLGVVLYRLLTGRLPFEGTGIDVLWKIAKEAPPTPSSLRPDLPPGLETIVLKTMAQRPQDRYASAGELVMALDDWLAHPVEGRPATPVGDTADKLPPTADFRPAKPMVEQAPAPTIMPMSDTRVAPPAVMAVPVQEKTAKAPPTQRAMIGITAGAALVLLIGLLLIFHAGLWPDENNPPGKDSSPPRKEQQKVGPGAILAEAIDRPPGAPLSDLALVVKPALVHGVRSWTVDTRDPRGPVRALAYNSDGSLLATGGDDGTVRLWEADSLRLVRLMVGHDHAVRALVWSPGGEYLASAGDDGTVRIWQAASGQLLRTLRGHSGAVLALAWAPDGQNLASGGQDRMVRLWTARDGKPRLPPLDHSQPVLAVAWHPNGKTLASAGRETSVWLWETPSGGMPRPLSEHTFPMVNALAWSPDGKVLASAGQDGKVRLWDRSTDRPLPAIAPGLGLPVLALAWSPRGDRLATGTIEAVQTWNTSGKLIHAFAGHTDPVFSIAWRPDGKTLASAGDDGLVRIWNDSDGSAGGLIRGHPAGNAAVTWGPAGKELAVCGFADRRVLLWEIATAQLGTLEIKGKAVASWSPDGKILAVASQGDTIVLWDASAGRWLNTLRGHSSQISSLAWSADSKLLASTSADGDVHLWEVPGGKERKPLKGHAGSAFAVALAPDGKTVGVTAVASVLLWELGADKAPQPLPGHNGAVRALVWSPDGRLLATAEGESDGLVFFWRFPPAQFLLGKKGHPGGTFALDWSADSKTLASAGNDGMIRLWKGKSGELLATLAGHVGPIRSLAWSRHNKLLASAGQDGTIRLWTPDPAAADLLLIPLRIGKGVTLSSDGHWACEPGFESQLVYVVQTEQGQQTLIAQDFAHGYNWQNDPTRAVVPAK
jgi:WD40 repeat protein